MDYNQTRVRTSRESDHSKNNVWVSPAAAFISDDQGDASDEIFFQFAEKSRDGIVFIDREGRVSWLNERIEDLFGIQRERVVSTNAIIFLNRYIVPRIAGWKHFADCVHEAYAKGRDVKNEKLSLVANTDTVRSIAFGSFLIHDGSYRGWRIDLYRPLDEAGKKPVSGPDIQEEGGAVTPSVPEGSGGSEKEGGMRNRDTPPATTGSVGMPDFILRCDGNLDVMFASRGVLALLGYDSAYLQSRRLSDVLTPDAFRRTSRAYRNLIGGRETDTERLLTWECRRHDGGTVRVDVGLTAVWSCSGADGLMVRASPGGMREEAAMARAWNQIENNMEQFAMLNDRIRNPLQAIVGLADLSGGELADRIIEQARRIDEIVRELDRSWMVTLDVRESLRTRVEEGLPYADDTSRADSAPEIDSLRVHL
ncbi:MAG: hypothetical protein APR53_01905 [Methanoculleus sp. SDB]|nr:MAG: hypothetical protein APR53_01905 [Methanoculleus sp. SDB]